MSIVVVVRVRPDRQQCQEIASKVLDVHGAAATAGGDGERDPTSAYLNAIEFLDSKRIRLLGHVPGGASSSATASTSSYTFKFDACFSSDMGSGRYTSQYDVHRAVGMPIVEHTVDGYNTSVLAYGQTGSGKTFTMLGPGWDGCLLGGKANRGQHVAVPSLDSIDHSQYKGLMLRVCEDLLRRCAERSAEGDADTLPPRQQTQQHRSGSAATRPSVQLGDANTPPRHRAPPRRSTSQATGTSPNARLSTLEPEPQEAAASRRFERTTSPAFVSRGDDENLAAAQKKKPRSSGRSSKGATFASKYTVEIAFYEVYNEKVFDLLRGCPDIDRHDAGDGRPGLAGFASEAPLKIREHAVTGPYVENLTMIKVTDYRSVIHYLEYGTKQRRIASTDHNRASSRSHAIFQLRVRRECIGAGGRVLRTVSSVMHLVDLAGSERIKPDSKMNNERRQEAADINVSLCALGKVINILSKQANPSGVPGSSRGRPVLSVAAGGTGKSAPSAAPHVPFRDSALTWLLKDSFGGNTKTVMMAMISPEARDRDETLSTLRFCSVARAVVNKAVINVDAAESRHVAALMKEVEELRRKLAAVMMQPEPTKMPSEPKEVGVGERAPISSASRSRSQEDLTAAQSLRSSTSPPATAVAAGSAAPGDMTAFAAEMRQGFHSVIRMIVTLANANGGGLPASLAEEMALLACVTDAKGADGINSSHADPSVHAVSDTTLGTQKSTTPSLPFSRINSAANETYHRTFSRNNTASSTLSGVNRSGATDAEVDQAVRDLIHPTGVAVEAQPQVVAAAQELLVRLLTDSIQRHHQSNDAAAATASATGQPNGKVGPEEEDFEFSPPPPEEMLEYADQAILSAPRRGPTVQGGAVTTPILRKPSLRGPMPTPYVNDHEARRIQRAYNRDGGIVESESDAATEENFDVSAAAPAGEVERPASLPDWLPEPEEIVAAVLSMRSGPRITTVATPDVENEPRVTPLGLTLAQEQMLLLKNLKILYPDGAPSFGVIATTTSAAVPPRLQQPARYHDPNPAVLPQPQSTPLHQQVAPQPHYLQQAPQPGYQAELPPYVQRPPQQNSTVARPEAPRLYSNTQPSEPAPIAPVITTAAPAAPTASRFDTTAWPPSPGMSLAVPRLAPGGPGRASGPAPIAQRSPLATHPGSTQEPPAPPPPPTGLPPQAPPQRSASQATAPPTARSAKPQETPAPAPAPAVATRPSPPVIPLLPIRTIHGGEQSRQSSMQPTRASSPFVSQVVNTPTNRKSGFEGSGRRSASGRASTDAMHSHRSQTSESDSVAPQHRSSVITAATADAQLRLDQSFRAIMASFKSR